MSIFQSVSASEKKKVEIRLWAAFAARSKSTGFDDPPWRMSSSPKTYVQTLLLNVTRDIVEWRHDEGLPLRSPASSSQMCWVFRRLQSLQSYSVREFNNSKQGWTMPRRISSSFLFGILLASCLNLSASLALSVRFLLLNRPGNPFKTTCCR